MEPIRTFQTVSEVASSETRRLFGSRLFRRAQLDEDLVRLGHLFLYGVGYPLYQVLDLVGVEPVYDVDLGVHEHGVRTQVHREQAQDLVDLLKGGDGLLHALAVFLGRRRAYQERTRVGAELEGDDAEHHPDADGSDPVEDGVAR